MNKSSSQITFDFDAQGPLAETVIIAEENKVQTIDSEERILSTPDPDIEKNDSTETLPTKQEIIPGQIQKPSGRGRKSQKTFAAEADLVNVPEDDVLFQKQYYAIGEVSQMFKVNASLLRFWESEFDIIKPRKNRKGDRHFRPVDIKNLQLIYDLLRRRKLTIEGAKDFLKNNKKSQERFVMIQSLQKIRSFLLEVKASL
jgi:DNA-binding transcriptional MerR regulator